MDRNLKDGIILALIGIGIFLLPTLINYYFIERKTDTFYKRVDEDFSDCVKTVNQNPKDNQLCKEIKGASELAFKSATSVSETISFTPGLLFFLVVIIFNLRRRIEDLEKN